MHIVLERIFVLKTDPGKGLTICTGKLRQSRNAGCNSSRGLIVMNFQVNLWSLIKRDLKWKLRCIMSPNCRIIKKNTNDCEIFTDTTSRA